MQVWSLGQEYRLEESMVTYSRILAGKIPCTEEPDGLWSVGSQWVGHNWSNWTFTHAISILVTVKVKSLIHVRLLVTAWTVVYQASLSMGFSRQEYQSGLLFPSPGESSWPRDQTCISCIAGRRFTLWATWEVS